MKILIPSYKRCGDVLTLGMLSGGMFGCDDIIIATQTQRDFEAYTKTYKGTATIIYREGHCVGDNRNSLLEWAQKNNVNRAVMLDDDIKSIRFLNGSRANSPEQLYSLFSRCFAYAEKAEAPLWGCYPCDNRLSMKKSITISLLTAPCLGFLDLGVRFSSRYRIKEDYELCLRLLRQGRKVLRFNSFGMSVSHKQGGGCFEDWQKGDIYADMLVREYPTLCELDKRKKHKEIKLKKL